MKNTPLVAYYVGDNQVRDYATGKVMTVASARKQSYHLYMSAAECDLATSSLHHPDCGCKYCLYGVEALPASEY